MLSISSGFDEAELEAVLKKMDGDRAEHEQKLERQAQLLDRRAAKIRKLEGIHLHHPAVHHHSSSLRPLQINSTPKSVQLI